MPVLRQPPGEKRERSEVPPVRDQALRGAAQAVSRKRGARSGVSARVVQDMASRFKNARALWFAVNNDPNQSINDLAAEFYFAFGELIEGKSLRALTLRKIDRERVLAHAEE